MKVAAICPIGYVDRWGYQRHLYECLGSFASCADLVLLPESYRDAPGAAELRLIARSLPVASCWEN